MRLKSLASAACALMIGLSAHAATLGIAAPELSGLEWIKGQPVTLAEGKGETVYVVEFWATWCGPCRQTIPHLTELQKEHADNKVVFIGISDEDAETVATFVNSQGNAMDYRVATAPERGPQKDYMEAFNQGGIPTAFIVNKEGQIVWVGHPMGMDEVLEDVVAGTHDIEQAKRQMTATTEIRDALDLAFRGEHDALNERATKALEDYADMPEILIDLAWMMLNVEGMTEDNLELAAKIAKTCYEAEEEPNAIVHFVHASALAQNGDKAGAIEIATKGLAVVPEEDERLREIIQEQLNEWNAPAETQ